jgi:pimeloyl-ACP methyl ester carboxylesterase
MPDVETTRGTLFYTVSQGPADTSSALTTHEMGAASLVLVHGAGGSRLHWPAELRRLSEATVYTLDLPGHGRSEGPGCDTIDGYAQVVTAFMDAVGISQAIIVGHSMGSAIAQTLALKVANRVAGLVLVGAGARLRVAPAILKKIRDDFQASVELITRFAWSPETPPALTELGRQALMETSPDVLAGDFIACNRFDVMKRLGEIKAPTLVIAGSADQLTPVKYARFLVEHIPDARLAMIERAGHMMMLERPTEVANAVREFLSETGAVRYQEVAD